MFLQIIVVLVLLIPILAIVLDSHVGRALAARLEGRSLGPAEDVVTERVAYLESEVDRLNTELLRLSEESDFVQKLLEERAERPSLPRSEDAT
jgi:uncharacterized small protein (DUF1192 family)